MAQRPLLSGWDAQPQEPVGVDWGNSLSKDIWAAVLPAHRIVDASGQVALAGGSTEAVGAIRDGLSRRYTRSALNFRHTLLSGSTKTGAAGWTFYVRGVFTGSFSTQGIFGSSANRARVNSSGVVDLYLSSGARVTSSVTLAIDEPFELVAWGSAAAGYNLLINGTLNTGGGGWGNFAELTSLGGATTDATMTGDISVFLAWTAIKSVPEINLIRANPWQLFAPIPVPTNIYTPPPAPTGKRYRQIVSGWDSQPQEAIGPAYGDQIAANLAYLFNPGVSPVELVSGRQLTYTGGASLGANRFGKTAASSSTQDIRVANNSSVVFGSAVSVLWVGQVDALSAGPSTQLISNRQAYSATGIPFELVLDVAGNIFFFAVGSSGALSVAHGLSAGDTVAFLGTYDGQTQRLYKNGVQIASRSYSTAITNNTTAVVLGRLPSNSEPLTGKHAAAAVWSRGLTASEALSVSLNPWQLFAPITTNAAIYTPPAGVPLLSSPTLTSIATTSARPQVSITFP